MKEYIVGEDSYAYEMRRYDELEELIRCKDCKHRESWLGIDFVCKKLNLVGVEDDDYCSMAERKEE